MSCPRCLAAGPNPAYASERQCAFTDLGRVFKPDNWQCETLNALTELGGHLWGHDEMLTHLYIDPEEGPPSGWILLARYKRRGTVSSAVFVGDFWPVRPLTLEVAELALRLHGVD